MTMAIKTASLRKLDRLFMIINLRGTSRWAKAARHIASQLQSSQASGSVPRALATGSHGCIGSLGPVATAPGTDTTQFHFTRRRRQAQAHGDNDEQWAGAGRCQSRYGK